ncbi:MAG: hypothetical protein U9P44_02080, partial [archaeon]|nr:hypothetical protein [archaeon]
VLPGFHFTDLGKKASKEYVEKVTADNVLGTTTDINDLTGLINFIVKAKSVSGQIFSCDARII